MSHFCCLLLVVCLLTLVHVPNASQEEYRSRLAQYKVEEFTTVTEASTAATDEQTSAAVAGGDADASSGGTKRPRAADLLE